MKKKEPSLLKSSEEIDSVLKNAPDAIVIIDDESIIREWNPKAVSLFGWEKEEVLGKYLYDILIPHRFREAHKQGLKHYLLTGVGPVFNKAIEAYALQKKGPEIAISLSISPYITQTRSFFIAFIRDITESKKTEEEILRLNTTLEKRVADRTEALRQSEARFRRIFESQMVGFIFWNANGEIVEANDKFLEIVGYTRDDLKTGKVRWNEMTPLQYDYLDKMALEQIAQTGVCEPFEKEYYRKDGTLVPVQICATSFDNVTEKGVAYIMDISQRKKIETELFELNKNLENLVESRTAQLQLANTELESFSYSVSHDLRAPLRAINGFANILTEDYHDKLDDEGKRLLNTIITNAKKMGQLIDDLLHFSRIGKKDVNRILINLDQLVQEVALQLKTHEYEKTIIKTEHLGKVMADYTLTQLIFQNLISNALKYSSKKDMPLIEIGMKVIDNNKTYFIKDNGTGFNMEYYDKLFSAFQRLHRQDEFEGTGVGLAIVKKIVERHGGLIWAEGEPGKGAIFYFTLNS